MDQRPEHARRAWSRISRPCQRPERARTRLVPGLAILSAAGARLPSLVAALAILSAAGARLPSLVARLALLLLGLLVTLLLAASR